MKVRFPVKSVFLLLLFCVFSVKQNFAQAGRDGVRTITTSATIINDYTTLTSDILSGVSTIQVASSSLSANFSAPLSPGDLIFIIQMQGASIVTADDSTYGNITSYNNCGNYEFAEVSSVPNSTSITTSCPLAYNYSAQGKTQIIRVPRYATLTVNIGTSISATAWNGSIGGVVVMEVQGATAINGQIDVSSRGFRAGTLVGDNNAFWGVLNYRYPTNDYGAEKGESIAGSQADYDLMNGRYCKGAPANGGGGASSHDAGGGGGGNCGTLAWTGRGNPDVSTPTWANAWNLVYSGFATSTSSGGGEGGYSFSSSNQNALTLGTFSSTWGGDARRDNGGRGGRPLDYSTGRIFLGGGGGAGDQNDLYGGAGGNGGGIVYIRTYGNISGIGLINANGQNGFNTVGGGTDGAGGGGAGGTVILDASGTISGILVSANGGAGGNQLVAAFVSEAEGPGGGGSGGYIARTGGAISCFANGGNNGTTNSYGMTEFPPNGATKGGAGMPNETVSALHITTSPVNICAGSSATLSFTTSGIIPPGTTFNWYTQAIGGASVGTGTTYTTPIINSGPVTYYVAACPGSVRYPVVINIDNVTSSFTASTVCAGTATAFTGTASSSASTITGWSWTFGSGGATSSSQNPSFTYPSSGSYNVTLTATSGSGCTSSSSQTITVNSTPVINFSASPLSGCAPIPVTFTNTSTNANSFTWDFGDGTVVFSSTTPSHTYTTPGTYSVTVTGTNGGCTSTSTVTNMITVNSKPVSSFSSTPSVCLGDPINFTNLSTPNGTTITGYTWNFGDGGPTSSATNPSHTYASSGSYSVTLTANSSTCNDDTTITVVVSPGPVVAFTAPVLSGCDSLTVNFSNTTTGSPVYSWNFGDGSSTTSATNPSHTYTSSGSYTVTLIATQGSCADTLIRTSYITIHHQPTSSFSATSVCQGDSVHFTNASTGNGDAITGYTWNFGDGNSSVLSTPAHLYATSGSYSVVLAAATAYCTDYDTVTVNVSTGPVVNFSTASTSGCGSLAVTFNNTTTGSPSYNWNFGDGSSTSTLTNPSHTYTTPGTYTVTLIAAQGTCTDTLIRTSYINVYGNPLSSFTTANVCLGDSVHFNNLSSSSSDPIAGYAWDFGDGTTSSIPSAAHYYGTAGTYTVQLTASTAHCSDDTTISVTVSPGPIAAFSTSTTTLCGAGAITFSNTTGGSPLFTWNFGDGSATSSLTTPTHSYSSAGTYTVTLIASQGSCSDTLVRPNYISIFSQPISSFNTSAVCLDDSTHFTDLSTGNGDPLTTYSWTFGDGGTSSTASPSHLYMNPGSFNVTLTVSTAHCSDDTTMVVEVNSVPAVSFAPSATSVCDGSAIQFSNATTGATTYSWNFGDGGSSSLATPTHTYSGPGTYTVVLTATAAGGCSMTQAQLNLVTVHAIPVANFTTSQTSICQNDCVTYTNQSTGGANSWTWTFSGGNPTASISQNPPSVCYGNLGSYAVTLRVSNGFCSDTLTQSSYMNVVNCTARPTANFISSDTGLCGGTCVDFVDLSLNSTGWQWQFPGASPATSTQENPSSICYSTPGTYTVTLITTNPTGSDTLTVNNFIHVSATPATPSFTQTGNILTATSASQYQWYYNNIPISGATSQQYTATLSGYYSVMTTDANGCSATSPQSHVSLVGIEEAELSAPYYVYPNPVYDHLYIVFGQVNVSHYIFELTNSIGQLVLHKEEGTIASQTIYRIETGDLAPGVYFLTVRTDKRAWVSRIVR